MLCASGRRLLSSSLGRIRPRSALLAGRRERRRASAVGGYTATAVLSGLIGVATSTWQIGVLRTDA
jgi:hypothetical protein